MKRHKLTLLVLGVIGPGVAWAQMPATKVRVERAQMRPLPATMRLVATVEPAVRSVVGSEVEGLVVAMPAREGDRIEQGGVICRLNDDTLTAELAAAKARLGALQARLDELQAGTRAEQLAQLKAAYEEAQALFAKWTSEKQRMSQLQERGTANEKEMYDTQAEYLAAQQRMVMAQAQYDEGVNGPRVEVIAQARYAVAEQAALVQRTERDLAKTVLRAPFAGYVIRRATEVGQWVERGGPIVEMIDLATVLVALDAPERAFPYVKVNDRARVHVEALADVFDGRVKHITPQADVGARTFHVQLEVDNAAGRLKSGMLAWATVTTGPEAPVVAVPKDAVDMRQGTPHVCVVTTTGQGTTATPMPVTTGADIDDWIAIVSDNVAPDALVVVRGNEMLFFPSPVEVSNPDALTAASQPAGAPERSAAPKTSAGTPPPGQ
jgi:multidrug efflux pump subunit AcrA (membrane-fusion protein)